ncbi:MAG: hypothetical protein ACHQ6T_02480, partial [Myxococcota bacterium]
PRAKADDPKHGTGRWVRRMRRYRVSERAVAVLERILTRCRDEQIECLLIESPLSSSLREILDGKIDDAFHAALAGVQAKYDVSFQDFSARLGDDGFHDSSHGNRAGGAVFSSIVADEVIEPRWRAR